MKLQPWQARAMRTQLENQRRNREARMRHVAEARKLAEGSTGVSPHLEDKEKPSGGGTDK